MADEATIDSCGRLVIPKAIRDRLGLRAGTRLEVVAEEGRLVLRVDRAEPTLVERDGHLAVSYGAGASPTPSHREDRDRRIARLVDYAARR